jgi:hypothetical protein
VSQQNEIHRLQQAASDALVSGSLASALSAAVLSWRSKHDEGSYAGALNGPSQWLWGRQAAHDKHASFRQTGVGYLIHHGTSLFWAVAYERLFGARRVPVSTTRVIAEAIGTAACAYVVDYHFTPRRLQPGFEKHISSRSMVLVYGAVAAGLATATLLRRKS